MNPKLSIDIENFVSETPVGAKQVEGATGASYWILTSEAMKVRQQVLESLVAADNGDVEAWDAESIKSAGRERMNHRHDS